MTREYIRLKTGKQVGWVDEDAAGNKIVYNNTGKMISKYIKATNTTTDHLGKILVFGDIASGLLFMKETDLTEALLELKKPNNQRKKS